MDSNFQELKEAHALLLARYSDVLNRARALPFFVPSRFKASYLGIVLPDKRHLVETPPGQKENTLLTSYASLFSLRYLVRLFVELHIRARLQELSTAYLYLAQRQVDDERYVAWLRDTSGDCAKLAETLTSWQSLRTIVGVGWPFVLSLVTAALGIEKIDQIFTRVHIDAGGLVLAGLILLFPLIYLALFISSAFESKRELFMPGFDRTEEPLDSSAGADLRDVIYVLEDEVFRLAERRKPREIPLDVIGIATSCFIFAFAPVLIWIAEPSSWFNRFLWLAGVLFGLLGVAAILYGRKRKWR